MGKKVFDIWKVVLVVALFAILALAGCIGENQQNSDQDAGDNDLLYVGKNILIINSYHDGFWWSDREQNAAEGILNSSGADIKAIHMDTKNNPSEDFKINAATQVKAEIEEYEPDIIITFDDNAFKYVIMPYYKDADIPVVFAGINGDSSVYGTPYTNVAGIEETPLVEKMVENIISYTNGTKAGYLSQDVLSEQKNVEFYNKSLEDDFAEIELVDTFQEWKNKYIELQESVDYLFIGPCGNVEGWGFDKAEEFVLGNVSIPSVTQGDVMMSVTLVGIALSPEEHGRWAAETALEILDGKEPSDFGIIQNEEGKLLLNLKIANKIGITFDSEQIKNAEEIIE